MKINNSIITGLYKYNPTVIYTIGDYVLSNNTIYEVLVPEVLGVVPSVSSNYKLLLSNSDILITDLNSFLINSNNYKPVSAALMKDIIYYYIGGLIGPNNFENYSSNPDLDINYVNRNCIIKIGTNTLNSPIPFESAILRCTGFDNQNNYQLNSGGTVYQEVYSNLGHLAIRSGIYNNSNNLVTWDQWNIKFDQDSPYIASLKTHANAIIDQIAIAHDVVSEVSSADYKRCMISDFSGTGPNTYDIDFPVATNSVCTLIYDDAGIQKVMTFMFSVGVINSKLTVVNAQTVTFLDHIPLKLVVYV